MVMRHGTWSSGEKAPRWMDADMESLGKASILLVEDDRDIRDMLVRKAFWTRLRRWSSPLTPARSIPKASR